MRKILFLSYLIGASLLFAGCNPLEWKQQAGLQVMTNEVPSSLFLDDQYLDKTPFINKKIKPGNYTLRIQPDDASFVPYDIPLTLHKGTISVVTWKPSTSLETSGGVIYEMEKLSDSKKIEVEFQTIPNNAILTLDGGSKQFSPLVISDITEGTHSFEVSLPSYEIQEHSVTLLKGYKVIVTVILGKTKDAEASPEAEPTPPSENSLFSAPEATSSSLNSLNTSGTQVQILKTGFFVNDKEVLRVRSTPSSAGEEIGFAPVGMLYPYKEEKAGWFAIEFEKKVGWISSQFSQKITATKSAESR
jgi:hypothetical protein